jgi:hypothetical protein
MSFHLSTKYMFEIILKFNATLIAWRTSLSLIKAGNTELQRLLFATFTNHRRYVTHKMIYRNPMEFLALPGKPLSPKLSISCLLTSTFHRSKMDSEITKALILDCCIILEDRDWHLWKTKLRYWSICAKNWTFSRMKLIGTKLV